MGKLYLYLTFKFSKAIWGSTFHTVRRKERQSVAEVGREQIHSSCTPSMDYSLPRLRTKFGEWAFSHAGPATWNALPDHIRTVADPVKIRKLLKSLYFSQAFNS